MHTYVCVCMYIHACCWGMPAISNCVICVLFWCIFQLLWWYSVLSLVCRPSDIHNNLGTVWDHNALFGCFSTPDCLCTIERIIFQLLGDEHYTQWLLLWLLFVISQESIYLPRNTIFCYKTPLWQVWGKCNWS